MALKSKDKNHQLEKCKSLMWGDGESWWLETKLGLNVILLNMAYKLKGLLQHVIAISALCICRLQWIRFNRGVKTTLQGLFIFLIIISKRVLYSFSEKRIHHFVIGLGDLSIKCAWTIGYKKRPNCTNKILPVSRFCYS